MTPKTYFIDSRQKFLRVLSLLSNLLIDPAKPIEIVVKPASRSRSAEQNKRMWAILHEIAEQPVDGQLFPAEAYHVYFRGFFLGYEDYKLPNGKFVSQPISTTTLDVPAFSEYMAQIEAWAAQHGILLSDERMVA